MKERCYDKNHKSYHNYRGRGIIVCDEWLNSLDNFKNWSLANGFEDNLILGRKDINKDYTPNNCIWTTFENQQNNKTTTKKFSIDGITKSLMQWCREYNKDYSTVHKHVFKDNWSIEEDLGIVNDKCNKKYKIMYNDEIYSLHGICKKLNKNYSLIYRRARDYNEDIYQLLGIKKE